MEFLIVYVKKPGIWREVCKVTIQWYYMTFPPILMKINYFIQKILGGIYRQTHTQNYMLMFTFFSFENKYKNN
jgi:hypothetical protein